MTSESIRSSVANSLSSSWATCTSISWPNKTFIAPQGPWIRPTLLMGESFIGELGSQGIGVRVGVLMISVFTLPNDGLKNAFDYADRLEKIFRRKDLSGVMFKEPSSSDKGLDDNGYNKVIMSVDFETWIGES